MSIRFRRGSTSKAPRTPEPSASTPVTLNVSDTDMWDMFASMQTKAKDEKGKEPEKKEGKESTFSAPCTIGGSEGVDNEKETKEEETKEEGTKEEGKSQGKEKKKTEKKKTENKKLEYSEDEATIVIQKAIRRHLAIKKVQKRKKAQKSRLNVAKEMVDTEISYVKTLETIINDFLAPLRASGSNGKGIVSEDDIKVIFSSVEVIYGFSIHLLEQLTKRFEDWKDLPPAKQTMGDIFVEMTSYTKVYISYVTNYETAEQRCLQLKKKNEKFEKWEHETLTNVPGGFPTLSFLLVTPVQRIPRYLMLVGELLKATWEGHADQEPLGVALKSIKELASLVDQRTQETDRVQKIAEVEQLISGKFDSLREANRRYVMEGEVEVVVERKEKSLKSVRYLFLFNDILVVCKHARTGSFRGSLRGSLKNKKKSSVLFEFRSRYWLATSEKLGSVFEKNDTEFLRNLFELNLPNTKLTLCTTTAENRKKWIDNFQSVFAELEPKVQFRNDVAKKMATEKAKRARALIAQQYSDMKEEGGGEGEEEAAPSNRRAFRAHRENYSDMKRMENSQKAEKVLEERQKEKERKKEKEEEEAGSFEDLMKSKRKTKSRPKLGNMDMFQSDPNVYSSSSSSNTPPSSLALSNNEEGSQKEETGKRDFAKKKKKRNLTRSENAASPE